MDVGVVGSACIGRGKPRRLDRPAALALHASGYIYAHRTKENAASPVLRFDHLLRVELPGVLES
jgi:hypothetical protein